MTIIDVQEYEKFTNQAPNISRTRVWWCGLVVVLADKVLPHILHP